MRLQTQAGWHAAGWALAILVTSLLSVAGAEEEGAEALFRRYCAACHGLTGAGDGPNARNLDPPPRDLTDRRYMRRLTDGHLARVIRDGGEAAGKSRLMPAWGKTLTAGQIGGLVAFVQSLPARPAPPAPPAGEALAAELNCAGCHEIPGQRRAEVAPNLGRAGTKFRRQWLISFLRRPGQIRPLGFVPLSRGRMPGFDLSELEAEAIAEFLMAQREGEIPGPAGSAASPDAVPRGEQLFKEKYPCLACHRLQDRGGAVGPDLTEVGARLTEAWLVEWLQGPQRLDPKGSMVNLGLPGSEAADIARYLLSLRPEAAADAPPPAEHIRLRAQGQVLVQELGCAGCHRIAAIAPPAELPRLSGAGDKLRPDWLTGYLHSRVQIRPWLRGRMPEFRLSAAEGQMLSEYLQSLQDRHLPPPPQRWLFTGNVAPARVEAGRLLASREYFDCGSCHVQGTQLPEGPREGWAPDLVLAGQRLQPDWIVRWLQNPQRLQPGTRMPSFFSDDRSGPEDILGGDEEEQLLALRDYLISLGRRGRGQP